MGEQLNAEIGIRTKDAACESDSPENEDDA